MERELRVSLYGILGFYPHKIGLYKQALRHKSLNKHGGSHGRNDNERLEFLGDAILDAIVGDIVYDHFRQAGEGFLTNTRSKIVQRNSLNRLAHEVGLDRLINSRENSSSHNSYMGGNAFEALVGAIYLDRGYDAVMHFMRHRILRSLIDIDNVAAVEVNFKSKLIEWCQKHKLHLDLETTEEERDHHASPVFCCHVTIEGVECDSGRGYSKKESHQRACQATLASIKVDRALVRSMFEAKELREQAEAEEAEDSEVEDEEIEEENEDVEEEA